MGRIVHERGKCIAQVGHLKIFQKNKTEVKEVNGIKKESTIGTVISIYNGKKMVTGETGFKNKAAAIARANELIKAHIVFPEMFTIRAA
jgi:hypothetical protein